MSAISFRWPLLVSLGARKGHLLLAESSMEKGLDKGATSLLGTCGSLQGQQVDVFIVSLSYILATRVPESSGIELEMRYNDFLCYQESIQTTLS